MKTSFRILVTASALALATASFGWIDAGHMVISSIAEGRLNKAAWDECTRLLAIGGTDKAKDFIQASCWADDTRAKENGSWHYINLPYRPDGKPSQTKPEEKNVVWAINLFSEVLKDKKKPDAERSDALRYLIHFVEDLHQPLHAVSLESDEHPTGDHGGNDFTIKTGDLFTSMQHPPTNLHFLWDMGCGIFMPNPDLYSRPLSKENEAKVMIEGQNLTALYPPTTFYDQIKDLNPMDWANESLSTAQNFVYKVRTGGEIDLAYITIGKTIAGKRAVLAGYRLAALLNKLVGGAK